MTRLSPYLRFDGNCKEAMTFYKDCLGGEITIQTIGETPMAKEMPADKQNLVMHAMVKKGDLEFYAADMMRDPLKMGENVSLCLNCDSEEEIRKLFAAFGQGGEVFSPLEVQFWGSLFGVLTDKYGIEWMFNYDMPKK